VTPGAPNAGPGAALLRYVAETREAGLPKPVLEVARLAVLDWWGVTLAGAAEPVAVIARDLLAAREPGPCSVLGIPALVEPVTAAVLNGTAAHALDYDDVHLDLPGHVTAPILPGLVAIAEAREYTGRQLLTAFVLGVEVMCRVARALRPGHYRAGWHATATLGRLGAAVAAARLVGLPAAGLDGAAGLAAAQGGGIQESFGTMAKPFQVGRAAGDGLLGALAAEAGMTAPRGVLDHEGWARRLSPTWNPAEMEAGLGERFALPAIVFKRYPCCFATHAAIRGLLALAPGLSASDVEAVDLEVCPTTLQVADQRGPQTGLGGKFSMTYCAAAAVVRGHVREDAFTDTAVTEPAVAALATRVRLHATPALDETRARVRIALRGGAGRETAVDLRADDDLAATGRELREKFRGLATPRLGPAAAEALADTLGRLEDVESIRTLTRPADRS
jgi:2-methylcitrate dehydratase PrpD